MLPAGIETLLVTGRSDGLTDAALRIPDLLQGRAVPKSLIPNIQHEGLQERGEALGTIVPPNLFDDAVPVIPEISVVVTLPLFVQDHCLLGDLKVVGVVWLELEGEGLLGPVVDGEAGGLEALVVDEEVQLAHGGGDVEVQVEVLGLKQILYANDTCRK